MKLFLLLTIIFSSQNLMAKPFCVAHRSLGFGEVENSLAAFNAAFQAGAKAVEFDLHHTKDSKTIIYHDKVFKRGVIGQNCPKGPEVKELNFKSIRSQCTLSNGEPVPTFEEALQVLVESETRLFVELKDTITEQDFTVIKKYYQNSPEKVFIISFDKEALNKVIEKRKTDDYFKKIKIVLLKKYGFFGSLNNLDGIDAKYIHKSKVKRLKGEGKLVGVYTKDSAKRIEKYLKKGVDFITTNESRLCEEVIDRMF